jgi:hypothetical protein
MNISTAMISIILSLGVSVAVAADPTSPPVASAIKDCKGLAADARKECEKVATQMDQSAQGKAMPPPSNPPNTPDADKLHHSSPIMQTPEERVAAEAVAKGKDPKQAIDKLHAKEGQPNK